jgi:hypothetical protein
MRFNIVASTNERGYKWGREGPIEVHLFYVRPAIQYTQETAMSGKMALIVPAATTALALSVAPSLAGGDMGGGGGDRSEGGGIVRCSLDGVNPAHHPEIFGNPAVAASYGFVQSRDGTWHVQPNCRR